MENISLKCMVVDDSSVQRASVIKFIEKHKSLRLTGEYHNAINARKYLQENETDLIFLDVEMPIISGFELLESLDHSPQVIIVSGNPDYALRAFDYNVTDYLLKPITMERFKDSIKRALVNHQASQEQQAIGDFIYVNSNLKKVKVLLKDINWIEGFGDYVKIITENGNLLVLSTMKSFLTRLPEDKFFRIHKSYIINLEKVDKFNTAIVEVCGQQLPLSRHKKDGFETALLS